MKHGGMLCRAPVPGLPGLKGGASWPVRSNEAYPTLLSFVGVHASGINPLGALAAAFVVSGLAGGRPGVTVLLRRMIRVRVGPRWSLIALLLPACFAFLSLGLNLLFGAPDRARAMGELAGNRRSLRHHVPVRRTRRGARLPGIRPA